MGLDVVMDIEFNLQTFLRDMRNEHTEQITALRTDLTDRVDRVLEHIGDHETRLQLVERTGKNVRWLMGTVVAAILGGGADFLFNHVWKK